MEKCTKDELLALVEEVIKYNHKYYCTIHKMDRSMMHPEEIINEIRNYASADRDRVSEILTQLNHELDSISKTRNKSK